MANPSDNANSISRRDFVKSAAIAAAAVTAAVEAFLFDTLRLPPGRTMPRPGQVLRSRRRKYAAVLIHLGTVSLAVGVAGSSLGTRSRDVVLRPGETIRWENFSLRCLGLSRSDLPDKTIVSAKLEVLESDGAMDALEGDSKGDSPVFVGRKLGQSPACDLEHALGPVDEMPLGIDRIEPGNRISAVLLDLDSALAQRIWPQRCAGQVAPKRSEAGPAEPGRRPTAFRVGCEGHAGPAAVMPKHQQRIAAGRGQNKPAARLGLRFHVA